VGGLVKNINKKGYAISSEELVNNFFNPKLSF
jgi:hypothetical protein